MTRRIEAVRVREACIGQTERSSLGVHHRHELGPAASSHVIGERRGGVVGTLDQGGLRQLAHGQALAGREEDRRLAAGGRAAGHGDDVVELGVLEGDEHRHQLRDAGDRHALSGVLREHDLAGVRVLHEVGVAADMRRRRECGRGEGEEYGEERSVPKHERGCYLTRIR